MGFLRYPDQRLHAREIIRVKAHIQSQEMPENPRLISSRGFSFPKKNVVSAHLFPNKSVSKPRLFPKKNVGLTCLFPKKNVILHFTTPYIT